MFSWIRNTKLNSFMDAYLAPYKQQYRYWTGLLLFARIVINFMLAVNDQTNDAICSGDFKTQHPECFLQIPFFESQLWGDIVQMDGENALFGGLLDRCIVNNDFSDSTLFKSAAHNVWP